MTDLRRTIDTIARTPPAGTNVVPSGVLAARRQQRNQQRQLPPTILSEVQVLNLAEREPPVSPVFGSQRDEHGRPQ